MIRLTTKKSAGKGATKSAKPATARPAGAKRESAAEAKVEAPEVRKPDPEMPDALNRLDPKVGATATTARERRAEELRRKHVDDDARAKAEPKAEPPKPDAAKAEPKGKTEKAAKAEPKGKTATPAKAGPKGRARKGPNIGSVASVAILAGASNEDALKAVMKAFPDCRSNLGCMAWYRNKLRRDGLLPKAERSKKAA